MNRKDWPKSYITVEELNPSLFAHNGPKVNEELKL